MLDECESLRVIVRLAAACGAYGGTIVIAKLKELLEAGGVGGAPPTEAVAPSSTAGSWKRGRPPTYAEFRRNREENG
jgi:hypothetical protein